MSRAVTIYSSQPLVSRNDPIRGGQPLHSLYPDPDGLAGIRIRTLAYSASSSDRYSAPRRIRTIKISDGVHANIAPNSIACSVVMITPLAGRPPWKDHSTIRRITDFTLMVPTIGPHIAVQFARVAYPNQSSAEFSILRAPAATGNLYLERMECCRFTASAVQSK